MKEDNVIRDVRFAAKKQSERPAEPVAAVRIAEAAEVEADKKLMLEPFDDGFVFKFSKHPTAPGQFVLYNKANQVQAVCTSPEIADLLCQALRSLFMAAAAMADEQAKQAKENPVDTAPAKE